MKRRFLSLALPLLLTLGACANTGKPQRDSDLKGMGMVVMYHLDPGASEKEGVRAITDAGNRLFGPAILTHRNSGVSTSGGGKMSFPRWVHVTWRTNTTPGHYWSTGTVTGDYKVDVLDRIPEELFILARSEPNRVIVLQFRVADDGVKLAWELQDSSGPGRYRYSHHGGDF